MFCPRCNNNLGSEPKFPCACGYRGPVSYEPIEICRLHGEDANCEYYCSFTAEPVSCNGVKESCNCYFNSKTGYYEHHNTPAEDLRYLEE